MIGKLCAIFSDEFSDMRTGVLPDRYPDSPVEKDRPTFRGLNAVNAKAFLDQPSWIDGIIAAWHSLVSLAPLLHPSKVG